MATIKRFEDLKCWQRAFEADKQIFEYAKRTELRNDYPLKNQVLKSSGSVMDNIAEGFSRGGNKEFVNFLVIANGSAGEVRSQLHRMLNRGHIDKIIFDEFYHLYNDISKMIFALISYLKSSEYKGLRYKKAEGENTVEEPLVEYDSLFKIPDEF